ncbi:hypothetical protein [Micromonospora orduensis]|uniref:hypothetical protein n=1 Tax=Micromonospora orduensis TaxID=1420891 RepID=UPI00363E95B8
MTPMIDISPQVAENAEEAGAPGRFRIKMVNRRRRAAVDIKLEVAIISIKGVKGGQIKVREVVPTLNETPLILPGRRSNGDDDNAYRMRMRVDLKEALADRQKYVRVRIFARDEVSGFGKVSEMVYHNVRSDVIEGDFSKGQTFEIV